MKKTYMCKNKAGILISTIVIVSLLILSSISVTGLVKNNSFDEITVSNSELLEKTKDKGIDDSYLAEEEPCQSCADCFVNTIEGTAELCDGSAASGITVRVQSSDGTKTTTTGGTGYWQVDVGSLTGGNWTWGMSFTVEYSGSSSGIEWTGSDGGTVSQPPTCSFDCGTTSLTPSDSLTANADASPTSITPGGTVNFDGSASGGFPSYTWYWDFDGDGTSTQEDPSHQFNTWGEYDCELTVTDSCSDTDNDVVTITVNTPPNTPGTPSGPSELDEGESGSYSTSGTDPDSGQQVQYRFDWDASGGGDISGWTSLGASGHTGSMSHSWSVPGSYVVKAQTRDELGETSGWSNGFTVDVVEIPNDPPSNPSRPSGPSELAEGESGSFCTEAIDPDGHQVKYRFDWDAEGGHDYSSWTTLVGSGQSMCKTNSWSSAGTYVVKAQAQDELGENSGWSEGLVVIVGLETDPPNTPSVPDGPTTGDVGVSYTYSTSTSDPNGDQVQYRFDWDADGSHDYSDWTSLVNSGQQGSSSHSWSSAGTFVVKAQARDEHGAISGWSSGLSVRIGNQPPVITDCSYDSGAKELVVVVSDPDVDDVKIGVSWNNDGNVDFWTGFDSSGSTFRIDCSGRSGVVGVIAEDVNGGQSSWVDQKSRNKAVTNVLYSILFSFLEDHPYLFPLLRQILKI